MPRLGFLAAACLAISAWGQQGARPLPPNEARLFVSGKYGFSIDPPAGWRIAVLSTTGLPVLANFPWSRLPAQLLLPNRGAMIHIVAEDGQPGKNRDLSLEDWAEFDQRGAERETVSSRGLDMPPTTGVSRATIEAFDDMSYDSSEQRQHHFTVYWEFRGKRFATYLDYVAGDPKGDRYEAALIKLMRSIRPL
jgi:hypothetical protein